MKKSVRPNGFSLLEALVALLIVSLCALLAAAFMQALAGFGSFKTDHQNQYGILQVRQILAAAREVDFHDSQITYQTSHKEFVMKLHKDRLVIEPGYEILLTDLEDSRLFQEGGTIYLQYKEKKIQLY